ncbi:MAG: esterase family protein [Clostridiales bacterium]|nr:esterase family protein [Clostridiales bacterium]
MNDSNDPIGSGNEMNREEISMFASGKASSGEAEGKTAAFAQGGTAVVLPDGIEERCPEACMTTSEGVDYGEFTHGTYFSKTCGMERGYSILLPSGYDGEKHYPVLYLLHGIFGDEYSFSGDPGNKLKEIFVNMAEDGSTREMIVVCPNMFAATDPDQKPGFDAQACIPYDNFINDLVNDLMPYIESHYAVLTGRKNTYLAGFSMGGRETIYITLMRPELFGYVCSISAAPGIVPTKDKFMEHPGQMTESEMRFAKDAVEPEAFILCCGSSDSVVGTYPESYHEIFTRNGAAHIWYEISGADHDNDAIRSGLYNLLKNIGADKAKDE